MVGSTTFQSQFPAGITQEGYHTKPTTTLNSTGKVATKPKAGASTTRSTPPGYKLPPGTNDYPAKRQGVREAFRTFSNPW